MAKSGTERAKRKAADSSRVPWTPVGFETDETFRDRMQRRRNPPGTFGAASECRIIMKDGKHVDD